MKSATDTTWQENMISGGMPVVNSPVNIMQLPPSNLFSATEGGKRLRLSRRGKAAGDRWMNYLSSFGAFGSDPMASTYFSEGEPLGMQTLEYLYENDWLCKRIVEAIVNEATRKGFFVAHNLPTEQKKPNKKQLKEQRLLENQLKEWDSLIKCKHLNYQARLYGGAAKLYFTEDAYQVSKYPLVPQTVKELADTTIINRFYCRPKFFYQNYNNLKRFKQTQIYEIFEYTLSGFIPQYDMHQTRMVIVDGAYLPEHRKIKNWGWGNSILQVAHEPAKNLGVGVQSIGSIIQDFQTKVLKLENFEDLLEDNEDELNYRISQADARSNIHNISVIGPKEEMIKIATPVQNLADLVIILMDIASASAETPKSELIGNMTGQLGSSSGKYDRDAWHDKVETFQDDKCTPVIEFDLLLACMIHNIDPTQYKVVWNPLREKEAKTEAETRLINSRARNTDAVTNQIEAGKGENQNFDNRNKSVTTERNPGRHELTDEYETEID